MATNDVGTFTDSLAALDVSVMRVSPADAPSAIDEAVIEPAIGAPIGIEGVSLADTVVETELTPRRLHEAETGVTRADRAVAIYGSLLVRSDAAGTEPVSLYPPTHVAVVRERDVLDDIEASVDRLGTRSSARAGRRCSPPARARPATWARSSRASTARRTSTSSWWRTDEFPAQRAAGRPSEFGS